MMPAGIQTPLMQNQQYESRSLMIRQQSLQDRSKSWQGNISGLQFSFFPAPNRKAHNYAILSILKKKTNTQISSIAIYGGLGRILLNNSLFIYSYWVLHRTQQFSLIISSMIYHPCTIYSWVKTNNPPHTPPCINYWKQLQQHAGRQWIKNPKFMWIFTFIPSIWSPFNIYSSPSAIIQRPFGLIFSDLQAIFVFLPHFFPHTLQLAKHVGEDGFTAKLPQILSKPPFDLLIPDLPMSPPTLFKQLKQVIRGFCL